MSALGFARQLYLCKRAQVLRLRPGSPPEPQPAGRPLSRFPNACSNMLQVLAWVTTHRIYMIRVLTTASKAVTSMCCQRCKTSTYHRT